MTMSDEERQAGRIVEIQNIKIGLRKLSNQVMELRINAAEGLTSQRLSKAEDAIDLAIDRLDDIRRTDL